VYEPPLSHIPVKNALLPLPPLSDLLITIENHSFLASSRTHSNKSFSVANLCLVVKCSQRSIQTTTSGGTTRGIGGGASSTFTSPKEISSFGGGRVDPQLCISGIINNLQLQVKEPTTQ
jgi:hypothetical protein